MTVCAIKRTKLTVKSKQLKPGKRTVFLGTPLTMGARWEVRITKDNGASVRSGIYDSQIGGTAVLVTAKLSNQQTVHLSSPLWKRLALEPRAPEQCTVTLANPVVSEPIRRVVPFADLNKLKVGDVVLDAYPFQPLTIENEQEVLTNGRITLPRRRPSLEWFERLGIPPMQVDLWPGMLRALEGMYFEGSTGEVIQWANRELPLRWEGTDAEGVLTNGRYTLSRVRPKEQDWPYFNRTDIPDELWWSFVCTLEGKRPFEVRRRVVREFWESLPPFEWGEAEGAVDAMVSGALVVPIQRKLVWWPVLEKGEVAPGLWPTFVAGLEGVKPSALAEYRKTFSRTVLGPFRWVTEDEEVWLTNGKFSFPRTRPEGRKEWEKYPIKAVEARIWLAFLEALEGKHLQGVINYRRFLNQARQQRQRQLTDTQQRLQRALQEGKLWKGKDGVEYVAVGNCLVFPVPRSAELGDLYVVEGKGSIYLFPSFKAAARLAGGLIPRRRLRLRQLHVDHRQGRWEDELDVVLATVKSTELTKPATT